MDLISTKTHGYLDYLISFFLIVAPFAFRLDNQSTQAIVLYVFGITMLFLNAITDYELGFMKSVPMKSHLTLDLVSGIFLAVSPWLFDFANVVYLPHLILGIMEVGVAMITNSKSHISK